MTMSSDCPYRPGTPEWSAWQRDAIAVERDRRWSAGEFGATDDEKKAAGLAASPTMGRRGSIRLTDVAEPWRSRLIKVLRQPPEAPPLQCPWCERQYKRLHAYEKHVPGCDHWTRIDSSMYASGDYVPTIGARPWRITGYVATPEAQARWAAEDEERRRAAEAAVARFGPDAVHAIAVRLGSKRWPDVSAALTVLTLAEKHGWTPPAGN